MNKFKFLTILFLVNLLCNMVVYSQPKKVKEDDKKRLDISIGIDQTITLSYVPNTQPQIGNESIVKVDFIPAKKQIIVSGLKPGKSSLVIRNTIGEIKSNYIVTVTKSSHSEELKNLKDSLGDVEGLEFGVKGDRVYVGGRIVVPKDIGKVGTILKDYPEVIRLYVVDPKTQLIIAQKMQKEMIDQGLRNVRVRVLNDVYIIEGQVGSVGEQERVDVIAKIMIPDKIKSLADRNNQDELAGGPGRLMFKNFTTVNAKEKPKPAPKLLKITAQFVELTKDYQKVFGFKWQPLLTDGGGSISIGQKSNGSVSTSSSGSLAATISNLFPKLSSAKAAGYARVIQSGTLVIKDGIKGSIEKSEKTPFALGSKDFTKATAAEAKFNLIITPKILAGEKVDMEVGVTVKSTSPAGGGADGTTALKELTNKISTNIIVKSKESAVVGGIVINKSNTNYDKDPPGGAQAANAGSSPLFNFVRSKSYTASRSQFVVFITPVIIDSASQGTAAIKKKFRKRGR